MKVESAWNVVHGLRPAMVMVLVQVVFAGVNIFYKLAAIDGMSLRVLIAYRFLFAAAFIVPLALIFERNRSAKLTWIVVLQAFFCGLFGGSLAQNLYLQSLALTSATFASAMANLVPAVTFIMGIAFGLERLGFRTLGGKLKVLGTLIGISGAMLLTLYKGPDINIWSTNINLIQNNQHGHVASSNGGSSKRVAGALLALGSCLSYAFWLIIQAKMCERYPNHYSCTALMSVMAAIQAVGFALFMEKDRSQWKLGWNVRLLTVAYSGIVASALIVTLMSWCVRVRGPFFVSAFNPLMLVLVALAGSLILNEKLHLASVLGGALIVCGLYLVLWGKSKEIRRLTQLAPSKSSREAETLDIVVLPSSMEDEDNNANNIAPKGLVSWADDSNCGCGNLSGKKSRREREREEKEDSMRNSDSDDLVEKRNQQVKGKEEDQNANGILNNTV